MDWRNTTFQNLPSEVLVHIGSYLRRADKASLALVSRALRKISEEILYNTIDFRTIDPPHARRYLPNTPEARPKVRNLWLLHRTLTEQANLASLVKDFRLNVCSGLFRVKVPSTSILQHSHSLAPHVWVQIEESLIASSLIFSVMHDLRNLIVCVRRTDEDIAEELLGTLDLNDANATQALGLRKLKSLKWDAPGFHHALASLPSLRQLAIGEGSRLIFENPPQTAPNNIHSLSIERSNEVMNSHSMASTALKTFLAHYRSLEKAKIVLRDYPGYHPGEAGAVGSYFVAHHVWGHFTTIVRGFEQVQEQLEELAISLNPHDHFTFLEHCLPARGLENFTRLRKLEIPYEGIVPGFQAVRRHPDFPNYCQRPLAETLPESLESLTILYPELEIYNILRPLIADKAQLPCLKDVRLHCSSKRNDNYETFAFINQPNEVKHDLQQHRGIMVAYSHNEHERRSHWDNYDLAAMLLEAWQSSLGSSSDT